MSRKQTVYPPRIEKVLAEKYKDIIWKDVPGCEGHYKVSNKGHVLSVERTCRTWQGERRVRERLMKQRLSYSGKLKISAVVTKLSHPDFPATPFTIARLVLMTFYGDQLNKVPRHLDGDFKNNVLENLAWSTFSEIAKISKNGGYFKSSLS